MANRQWELKEMLEAVREQMKQCEEHRFDTAHGCFWMDTKAHETWMVLKEREEDLLSEKAGVCKQRKGS